MRTVLSIAGCMAFLWTLCISPAGAEIRCFRDARGTLIYTNVPVESGSADLPAGKHLSVGVSFDRMISRLAKKYALDPDLVRAVVEVESNFDELALSGVGAMGLMQLMPWTAEEMGVEDPFEPLNNLEGGCRYLSRMLDRFGDVDLALAAYNAGPENVKKYDGIPPYQETRDYVAKVMASYERLKRR